MNVLDGLNKYQQAAVKHFQGPLIVMAGAGSGKTRCLVHRVAYLIQEKQVRPNQIVLLTFTNKAAGEMKTRVFELLGEAVRLGFAGTFHSFGAFLLRRLTPFMNRQKDFVIYDSQDTKALLGDIIKDFGLEKKIKVSAANFYVNEVKRKLLDKKDRAKVVPDWADELEAIYQRYEKTLKENNAFDFGDLLTKTYQLLKQNPEALDWVQSRFKFFLVDEYQDTNYVQYQLIKLMAFKDKNLFVVGDFSQAIYGFRGADYKNIGRLKTDLKGVGELKLPTNYRSYPEIIKAASQVIQNNLTHPTIKLKANRKGSGVVWLLTAADDKHEALLIGRKIIELLEMGRSPGEIAVLYRTHGQSRAFEEVLIKAGLEYHIVGGWRFFERKEIKDIMAYVRLFVNPSDPVAYKRAVKLGKRRLAVFQQWLSRQSKNKKDNPGRLIKSIIEATGYTKKLNDLIPEDKARLENIEALINFASESDDLIEFFERASLLGAEENDMKNRYQANSDKINLMTIHAAKGLEFGVVFVTGLEEGLFPHGLSKTPEELEEERRLFYVALTRAKDAAFLSYAGRRLIWGRYKNQVPSRFLQELPQDIIKVEEW
ncbi:MAG: UvrD-helicase domain-containing protein [bacterium]|nr:UvrD-helicase domain-containing protein [bacterium]